MKKGLTKWFTGMMIGTLLLTTAGCGGGSAPAANSESQGAGSAKIGVVAYLSGEPPMVSHRRKVWTSLRMRLIP